MRPDGGQLAQRVMQPAVADQADHGAIRGRQAGAQRSGQGVTQRSVTHRGIEPAARLRGREVQVAGIDRMGRIAHQDRLRQGVANLFQEAQCLLHAGVEAVPGRFACMACSSGAVPVRTIISRGQHVQERLHGGTRIAGKRQIGRPRPKHLGGVDVDADQIRGKGGHAPLVHVVVGRPHFGSDGEHAIAGFEQLAHRHERGAGRDGQQVSGREQAATVHRHDRGRVKTFGQRPQRLRGPAGPAAGQDHGPLGTRQSPRCLVQGTCRWMREGRRRTPRRHVRRRNLVPQIERDLDVNRTRALAVEHSEGLLEHGRQVGQGMQRLAEGTDTGGQRLLVGQFVQLAQAAAEVTAVRDARDHQHGDGLGIRLRHRGRDIGQPRSGDDEAHARLAGHAGVGIGHEPRALLVARRDVLDRAVGQAVVEGDGMNAGDAEYALDAERFQQPDDPGTGAGCFSHHNTFLGRSRCSRLPAGSQVPARAGLGAFRNCRQNASIRRQASSSRSSSSV